MNLIQLSSQPPPLKLHLQDELILYFSYTHTACWKRLKHLSQSQPSKVAEMNELDWMGLYSLFSCFMYLYKLAYTGGINVIWLADARNYFICSRTLCPALPTLTAIRCACLFAFSLPVFLSIRYSLPENWFINWSSVCSVCLLVTQPPTCLESPNCWPAALTLLSLRLHWQTGKSGDRSKTTAWWLITQRGRRMLWQWCCV